MTTTHTASAAPAAIPSAPPARSRPQPATLVLPLRAREFSEGHSLVEDARGKFVLVCESALADALVRKLNAAPYLEAAVKSFICDFTGGARFFEHEQATRADLLASADDALRVAGVVERS